MKKLSIIAGLLIVLSFSAHATLQITVDTDKDVYQVGEDIAITITAYNPTTEPVIMTGGFYFTTYIMDETYDWAKGKSGPAVVVTVTVDPGESISWDHMHGINECLEYPLEIGVHSIVGKILAYELRGQNQSEPVEFSVIPEPFSLSFLFLGSFFIRKK
jgi:hypothetical protein